MHIQYLGKVSTLKFIIMYYSTLQQQRNTQDRGDNLRRPNAIPKGVGGTD
jgi:hypothetical protein